MLFALNLTPCLDVFARDCMITFKFVGELQDMKDILRYVSHSDPQLKGNIAVVIGHLLRAFLMEGRGSFDRWLQSTGLAEGLN